MNLLEDGYSRRLVENMMLFGSQIGEAERAIFFWLESDNEFRSADLLGMPGNFVGQYLFEMRPVDPMNSPCLTARKARVSTLQSEPNRGSQSWVRYVNYLAEYGIGDELNMLFGSGGTAVAGLAIYRSVGCTPFSNDLRSWEPIQANLEQMIEMHHRVRSGKVRSLLAKQYRLLPREIELISVLVRGASNAEIAETLCIAVPTVKTHIVNILDKMGVHSRAEIAACVNFLQFS